MLLSYFGMHKFRILFLSIAIVLSRAQASTGSSSDNQRYDVRNTEINEGEMSFLLIRLKMQTQKGDTSQQGMPNPGKLISHLFILNTSTRLIFIYLIFYYLLFHFIIFYADIESRGQESRWNETASDEFNCSNNWRRGGVQNG